MIETSRSAARNVRAAAREGASLRLVRGPLKGDGRPISLFFLGTAGHAPECAAFFESPPRPSLGAAVDPDVLWVAEPLPVLRSGALRYHPFFDAVLDVAPTLEAQIQAVRSKAHRRRLRRASRSRDWEWTVGTREEDLLRFYTSLHRPYVEARFGRHARVDPLAGLQRRFGAGGRVLTVTHQGAVVCAALLLDLPGRALGYDRNGFRLDALASPLRLAERTAALELALFQLAQELQARTVELGFCRALLNDGLFTHKRRLGCRFVPAQGTGRYQLWVRPALRPQFFSSAPMVVGPCGALEAQLGFGRDSAPIRKTILRALLKNFALPSVHRAVVWTNAARHQPGRQAFEEALRGALGPRPVEVREV